MSKDRGFGADGFSNDVNATSSGEPISRAPRMTLGHSSKPIESIPIHAPVFRMSEHVAAEIRVDHANPFDSHLAGS